MCQKLFRKCTAFANLRPRVWKLPYWQSLFSLVPGSTASQNIYLEVQWQRKWLGLKGSLKGLWSLRKALQWPKQALFEVWYALNQTKIHNKVKSNRFKWVPTACSAQSDPFIQTLPGEIQTGRNRKMRWMAKPLAMALARNTASEATLLWPGPGLNSWWEAQPCHLLAG